MNAQQKLVAIWIGIGAAALTAAYVLYQSLSNFNKGTPYEGTGAVGTLGNVADKLSGGTLSSAGSALGLALYDLTHSDYSSSMTFTFTFVDGPHAGKKGAVNADEVDEDSGKFRYYKDGGAYILRKDQSGAKVAKVA